MAKIKDKASLQEKYDALSKEIASSEAKKAEIIEKIKKLKAEQESISKQMKELTFNEAEEVLSAENVDMESLIKAIKSGKLDISALKAQVSAESENDNSHS